MNDSTIDDLHEELFGTRPAKGGEAYERLVAIGTKLKDPAAKVSHDQRPVGVSGQPHQVDVLTSDTYVQTKDYTKSGNKVDLDDVKNTAGTIPDLADVEKAVVASATDFTEPARTFTAGAPLQKPVELVHVRPTVPEDDQNRIKTIHVDVAVQAPVAAHFDLVLTPETFAAMTAKHGGPNVGARLDIFYREDGTVMTTLDKLFWAKPPKGDVATKMAKGCWTFDEPGAHVRLADGSLLPVQGVNYEIRFEVADTTRMTIARKGEPKLLYKEDREEGFNKVFTDEDLKRATITEDGEVQLNGPEAVTTTRTRRPNP